jgi:hypothetical protein
MCFCVTVYAQVNASVGGSVTDSSGALIPGVTVTAKNVNTGIEDQRITNEAGGYQFPSLQPGTYSISASLPGFQTSTRENVVLSQGQQVRFNFTLQVGAVAQSVEVLADAATTLATTSASVGGVVPELEIRQLPTFSRNVLDLAQLIPGSIVEGTGAQSYGGTRQSQINTTRDGLPTTDGRYMDWNGVYAATFTSPDLVEEVQVNVTTADAAMGRGAGQVRMTTRSGTNQFHGALFYQNNNSALSSNGWFQNLVGGEKEFVNRNQFGGRIGGPILQNKAFFFFLYDGQRFVEKTEEVALVLTDQARQGIFRYLTATAPAGQAGATSRRNGNAFSQTPSVDLNGNVLTSSGGTPLFLNQFNLFSGVNDPNRTQIDPVWVGPQYLPRMPTANDWTIGDGLNTAGHRWLRTQRGTDGATGTTQTTNRNHYTVRVDYQLNNNNKVSYSMTKEENWGVTGQTGLPDYPGGYFGEVAREPDFYTATWTSTLSPTLLNEFRWGLKRDTWFGEPPTDVGCCRNRREHINGNLTELAQEAAATFPQINGHVFHITPTTIAGAGPAAMTLGQYAWMGVPTPRGSVSPLTQLADTISWTKGKHSFSGGFELTLTSTDQFNHGGNTWTRPSVVLGVSGNTPVQNSNGMTIAQLFPLLNASDTGPAQNILATLAGSVMSLRQRYYINSPSQTQFSSYTDGTLFWRNFHQNDWSLYFKDVYNIMPNLTLNFGLRYDVYGTPYDGSGLALAPRGGQGGLFGISGTDHSVLYSPGASGGSLTVFDFVGKNSPNPDRLVYQNDRNNFAPSVGFTWNMPWFSRPTVLRGGYGISYTGVPTFLQYSSSLGDAPGSALDQTLTPVSYVNVQNATVQFPLSTGGAQPLEPFPLTNRTVNIQGYADNRSVPYVQSFNLSIQRELARNMTLEVSYVGSKGTKLRSAQQLNVINVFENGILDAFNVTRAGGTAPLFDQMLNGLTIGSVTVGSGGITGSEALRRFTTTNQWIANGEVADLANWFNSTNVATGENGGILRNGNLPENFIVVNPQFGSVTLHGNSDNSVYHSLQTVVSQRLSRGFSGQFSYVWSRNIGNTAAGNSFASDTTSATRDPRNLALQRGLVSLHRTHNFKAHGTYALPFGPGQTFLANAPNWLNRVVEGWDVSGIFNWSSGSPLTFETDRATLNSRNAENTPVLLGALPKGTVTVGDGVVEYFPGLTVERAPLPNFGGNTTLAGRFTNQVVRDASGNILMQNPGPGTIGNMALNLSQVEGPSRLGFDMALSKRFQIDESKSFTIRADAINVLNTPQWANPETDINDGEFGRITATRGDTTRTITINARIDF